MTSAEQVLKIIFGGNVSIEAICNIILVIYTVVVSILSWRAKIKEIRKSNEIVAKDAQIEQQRKELEDLKNAVAGLGDIIVDAYLANPNVDADTKRALATRAEKIAKLSNLNLSETTEKLIGKATEYAPDSNLVKHAEDLRAEAAAADELLDTVSEAAQDAISRMKI